jgi:hypothetical protein
VLSRPQLIHEHPDITVEDGQTRKGAVLQAVPVDADTEQAPFEPLYRKSSSTQYSFWGSTCVARPTHWAAVQATNPTAHSVLRLS